MEKLHPNNHPGPKNRSGYAQEGGVQKTLTLYFLYPDYFERVSSKNSKSKIYASFQHKLAPDTDPYLVEKSPCALDRSIYQIREVLQVERQTQELDFYHGDLRAEWDVSGHAPVDDLKDDGVDPAVLLPVVWIEKSNLNGRPDRQTGPNRLGEALWSPQRSKNGSDIYSNMRRVGAGDIILHLTDNAGFTGTSRAVGPVDDTFTGVSGTEWAGQPAYRVQLYDFQRLEPELLRANFFDDGEIAEVLLSLRNGPDGKGLFFNRSLELREGAYLTRAPTSLLTILNRAYLKLAGKKLIEMPDVDSPDLDSLVKDEIPKSTGPQDLNTIFFGPPGTGKTYVTARYAVEICDGKTYGSSNEVRERYDQLVKQRRIEFVTFHQTYGYEEFVEGLRPETGTDETGSSAIGFRLQAVDGVLKRIAIRAARLPSMSGKAFDPSGRQVFKVSLGQSTDPQDDYLRDECLTNGYVLLGYGGEIDWADKSFDSYQAIAARWRDEPGESNAHGNSPNILFPFQLRAAMKEGDLVLASRGNRRLQAVGVVAGPYQFKKRESDQYHHMRPVRWLWKDGSGSGIPVSDILDRNFSQQSIYKIPSQAVQWDAILPYLQEKAPSGPPPPHVLIIDEINRANISKVLGELITLLEEDKRAGATNETSVILPHSGDHFALPANLYIIGTMNTADRSIALLDTALRRRFNFVEMPPDPGALSVVDRVNLPAVLEAINSRMEWFLGPDQLIGHAWFMTAKSIQTLDAIMATKIIPLLREYFHEDLGRVRAVLGGGDQFLRRTKISPPPGVDDYGEERYRFVDRYATEKSYGAAAYQEIISGPGIPPNE